jgi:superfamily II DNA/RNA helicase
LDETSRDTQVLVLSPTRELAEQTQRVMQSLGDFMNVRACKIDFFILSSNDSERHFLVLGSHCLFFFYITCY